MTNRNTKLCILGNFTFFCCNLLTFFKTTFSKIFSETLSECQTVRIQIRTDRILVLLGVQTVCKGYQQTTLEGKDLKV